jgi:hypothetical protein
MFEGWIFFAGFITRAVLTTATGGFSIVGVAVAVGCLVSVEVGCGTTNAAAVVGVTVA